MYANSGDFWLIQFHDSILMEEREVRFALDAH